MVKKLALFFAISIVNGLLFASIWSSSPVGLTVAILTMLYLSVFTQTD